MSSVPGNLVTDADGVARMVADGRLVLSDGTDNCSPPGCPAYVKISGISGLTACPGAPLYSADEGSGRTAGLTLNSMTLGDTIYLASIGGCIYSGVIGTINASCYDDVFAPGCVETFDIPIVASVAPVAAGSSEFVLLLYAARGFVPGVPSAFQGVIFGGRLTWDTSSTVTVDNYGLTLTPGDGWQIAPECGSALTLTGQGTGQAWAMFSLADPAAGSLTLSPDSSGPATTASWSREVAFSAGCSPGPWTPPSPAPSPPAWPPPSAPPDPPASYACYRRFQVQVYADGHNDGVTPTGYFCVAPGSVPTTWSVYVNFCASTPNSTIYEIYVLGSGGACTAIMDCVSRTYTTPVAPTTDAC